ncbi:hypothetical protein NHF40_01200 [Maricaulaceae bacterium EIL42A08]|nr:hypothetical protein [Maricaulaceae bacterium EIL42A08]
MSFRTFLTPTELGALHTKAERLASLWAGWANFLAEEATAPIVSQLTDPRQGKIDPDDLSLVVKVFNSLEEASGSDPTIAHDWKTALKNYHYRQRISQEMAVEGAD